MRLFSAFILSVIITLSAAAAWADTVGDTLLEVLHGKGVIDDASYSEIKNAAASGGEQAVNRKLIEVLYKKGVLDEASYMKLSEQAAKESAAQPKASAPSERPLDKPLTGLEEGFARLSGDTVKLKIGALIQAGWLNDDQGFSVAYPPDSNISYTAGNQFIIRRARLFYTFNVTDKLGFKISTEFTTSSKGVLQDAFVWADYIPYTRLQLGQFKQPFGLEINESIGDNIPVNRSFVTNFIAYPTIRDSGIMAASKYTTKVSGLPLGAGLAVGLFNGTGRNTLDDNDYKDVTGRAWVNPLVEGLTVGGSWSVGKTGTDSQLSHDRWGADIDYTPALVKGLKVRGEYMWERKFYTAYRSKNVTEITGLPAFRSASGGYAHSYGWYAMASYKTGGLPVAYLNGFEPFVRYDFLDEDTSALTSFAREDSRTRWTVGINYYLNKYTRLMANYEMIHADGTLKSRSLETIDTIGHRLFTTLVQIKF